MKNGNIFMVTGEEKRMILEMHKKATKNQYLLKEYGNPNPKNVKVFDLPKDTFVRGKYTIGNLDNLKNTLEQVKQHLSTLPKNQKIVLTVQASESHIPQKNLGFGPGELSGKRATETINTIKKLNILPQNTIIKAQNLGTQGPAWSYKEEEKDLPKYKNWQYVKFIVSVSGDVDTKPTEEVPGSKLTPEECALDFYVDMYYKNEWCDSYDICHNCNDAQFVIYANGIPLYNKETKQYFCNLNNLTQGTNGKAGPDVGGRMVIDNNIKKKAFAVNPNELVISIGCHSEICHGDAAGFKIYNSKGTVLMDEDLFSVGEGKKNKSQFVNRNIVKLNKCGEVIEKYETNAKKRPQAEVKITDVESAIKFLEGRGANRKNHLFSKDSAEIMLWAKALKDGKLYYKYEGWRRTCNGGRLDSGEPKDKDIAFNTRIMIGQCYGS